MDQKKLKIAYHETGHAVAALIHGQAIQKVSLREMESPRGTEKYHAFMKLEPADPKAKFTGEKAIQKIMISLGGFASEILFFDGSTKVGGDDLTIAVKVAGDMLQDEAFRDWLAGLPVPAPSALDMIENTLVRTYIDLKMHDCVQALAPLRPVIQVIAEELYEREELTGDEVTAIFDSYVHSSQRADHMNRAPATV